MHSSRAPLIILGIWFLATALWWGLAFYPADGPDPSWLVAAREVCFGTLPSGLPDTYGWMVLILGPLSFLVGFVVAWPEELKTGFSKLRGHHAGQALLLMALVITVAEASWVTRKIQTGWEIDRIEFGARSDEDLPDNYPQTKTIASDFSLTDQSGEAVRLSDLRGQPVLLTFAFAHCQTICPSLVMQSLEALNHQGDPPVKLLIVTLDPWRDTPRALPTLAEKWKLPSDAHVLSGQVDEVIKVIKSFNVPMERNEQNGDVTHPALTYLIHPDGYIAYSFNNAPSSWLRQAIQRIGHENDTTASR